MRARLVLVALITACSNSASNQASVDGGTDAAAGSADPGCEVPTRDLRAYLIAASYRQLPAEPAVHASTGPHFGNVRTFLTPSLAASLTAGTGEHPRCAAAVKELYGRGTTTPIGWAVAVKTEAASAAGAGWYWYETTSTQPDGGAIEGKGVSLCTGCHDGGHDYVLTPALD